MLNQIVLIGRLVADPEELRSKSGNEMSKFTLAVDRETYNKTAEKTADFIVCVAYKNTAKFINSYIKKGNLVTVTGSLHQSSYTNKNGVTIKTFNVDVNTLSSLNAGNSKKKEKSDELMEGSIDTENYDFEVKDEDLPF